MRFKRRSTSALVKKARRGVRDYPIGTVAFYGPDDTRASKLVASVLMTEDDDAPEMHRWFSDTEDLRNDMAVTREVNVFFIDRGVKSVAMADRIIGCPHERGYRLSGRTAVSAMPVLDEPEPGK